MKNIIFLAIFIVSLSSVYADSYEKVTGGYTIQMKVGNVNDNIKKISINNEKNYEIQLLYCETSYCAFKVNGIAVPQMRKDSEFQLDSEYKIKITNIIFDFCNNQRFCNIGFEAYDIVDLIIDGPTKSFCGNGVCDSGENCEEDSCCGGKKVDLEGDKENCRICGYKCDFGYRCDGGRCVERCPETNGCDYFTNSNCEKSPKNAGEACDCNEECSSLKCFNGKCTSNVVDLSSYPSFLTGNLITVVGDQSSSINVVAQTYILTSLSGISIKNKLASEVTDLNQNIISIGNPCVNEISAKIMNNPEPCDKDFQRGKGYIKLYKNDGFYHLIVAGYTDLGTKKAAEALADYKNYKFGGNEYVFEFSGDVGDRLTEEKKEIPKTAAEQEQSNKIEIKTETEPKTDIQAETKIDQKTMENKKTEEKVEPKTEEQNQTEKSGNIINKLISWFLSLFKK